MRTLVWRAAIMAGLLGLVAAACSPPRSVAPSGEAATPSPPQGKPGGRVIDSGFTDVQRLNPAISNDLTSSRVSAKIYDALIRIDPNTGTVKPWLGSWTVSPDGRTYSWTIDAKANWSDGNPIIARDFLARVKMQARSKVTTNKAVFIDISGYQAYATGAAREISGIAIDASEPKKFRVTLTRVFCPALAEIFGSAPMPDHVFGRYTLDDDVDTSVDSAPENDAPPVASGPFKFKEWRRGDQLTLVRNPAYFKGAPLLEEYVYKVVADSPVQIAQLKTGELTMGVVRPVDVAALRQESRLKLYRSLDNTYTFIGWRASEPSTSFLRDRRVRQALWYGIDLDAVVRDAFLGEASKQLQHHVVGSWAAAPLTGLDPYPYDRAKAEGLLRAAGFERNAAGLYAKDGRPLSIAIVTNSGNKERESFLQIASEQYRQLGISIESKTEPYESLVPKLTGGSSEIQAFLVAWRLSSDPDPFTVWHTSNIASPTKAGNNVVGYSNPDVDRLIEQARYGPDCSQGARQKAYQQMNRILNEEAPYMFGVATHRLLSVDARIEGLASGAFDTYSDSNIHLWSFR